MSRTGRQADMFQTSGWQSVESVSSELGLHHYLGAANRGKAWVDEFGLLVLAHPTSRHLPQDWLELTRWCLLGIKNGGSRQWARVRREIPAVWPDATTVVSYSDPSAGHSGALYRACGWKYAPTWHRIVTPPTGNGSWTDGKQESVKDRWFYPLQDDERREAVLSLPAAYTRNRPWLEWHDGKGADWKTEQARRLME